MTQSGARLFLQDELETLLGHDAIKNKDVPILFFANKVRGTFNQSHVILKARLMRLSKVYRTCNSFSIYPIHTSDGSPRQLE
jgi:hypothetical protein